MGSLEVPPRGAGLITDREIADLVERYAVGSQRTGGVLLVDDEPLNLTVMRSFLEEQWKVYDAGSGEEALAIGAQVPLDVVVADQRMPGMTGVELLEELRERRVDAAGIVLTAYADEQVLELAINRARAFRFLRKPWEPPEIAQAVEHASAYVVQRRTIEKLVTLLARRTDELRASLEELRVQQQSVLHLERLSTLGRLSSGVTHDLRNAMVSLRAVEWEIAKTTVSPPLREILTLGISGVDNLLHTLQTLNEYARTGALVLKAAPVDPAMLLSDALAISRLDADLRMCVVHRDVAPRLPRIPADRQKLTQVLVNLIRNALHATKGEGAVRVSARARGQNEVEFAVEDEGPGIPPEMRDHLFQPFVSSKGDQGLGMGLYLARLIVESHQGRIAALDRPEGGTRFEVVIPTAPPDLAS